MHIASLTFEFLVIFYTFDVSTNMEMVNGLSTSAIFG